MATWAAFAMDDLRERILARVQHGRSMRDAAAAALGETHVTQSCVATLDKVPAAGSTLFDVRQSPPEPGEPK